MEILIANKIFQLQLINKIAEIKLLVPGQDLFVKKQAKSFEESTDLAVEALRRQVKKYKEKKRQV